MKFGRKKKLCIVFKVDIQKAYDSVRWDFIYYVMEGYVSILKKLNG